MLQSPSDRMIDRVRLHAHANTHEPHGDGDDSGGVHAHGYVLLD